MSELTISNGRERRVTDEQARRIADCDPTVYVQPGLGPGVTTADLAADLLDARAEIAALRRTAPVADDLARAVEAYFVAWDREGGLEIFAHDPFAVSKAQTAMRAALATLRRPAPPPAPREVVVAEGEVAIYDGYICWDDDETSVRWREELSHIRDGHLLQVIVREVKP